MNHEDRISLEILPTKTPSKTNVNIILDIPTIFICSICLSDYQAPDIISGCSQKHHFCRACFTQYLEHIISESKVIEIVCPQDGCMETIDAQFIESLISAPLFEKYKTGLQNLQDKTQRTCQKPNCQKRIKISTQKEFTVCQCGTKICNNCGNYWHKDKTCLQAINEELGEFSQNNEIRLCINCKAIVSKIEGCPRMTCSVCEYQWCWDCGEEYLPQHVAKCPKNLIRIRTTARQSLRAEFLNTMSAIFYILAIVAVIAIIPAITVVGVILGKNQHYNTVDPTLS